MIKVKNIYEFLNKIAPFEKAMDFDNSGLLVGNLETDVKKILLSLDITPEICDEAKKLNANLIISHHPVIFKPFKSIDFKNSVSKLIKYEINAICAHTNLDVAEKGVNFHLASTLGLENFSPLIDSHGLPLGMIGTLDTLLRPEELALLVKNKLSCQGVRYTEGKSLISKVAVSSGSGGNLVEAAKINGADAFVTGEIKHSQILTANNLGITVIDAGHFKTENVIISPLQHTLKNQFKDLEFITSKESTDGIKYL